MTKDKAKLKAKQRRHYESQRRRGVAQKRFEKLQQKGYVYSYGAKKRGIEYKLTEEQFKAFKGLKCHYCDDILERVGIDRVDNAIGYLLSNCVPCCSICNQMKNKYTKEQFIEKCKKIIKKWG